MNLNVKQLLLQMLLLIKLKVGLIKNDSLREIIIFSVYCKSSDKCIKCIGCTDCRRCCVCVDCVGCDECAGCVDCYECYDCQNVTGYRWAFKNV